VRRLIHEEPHRRAIGRPDLEDVSLALGGLRSCYPLNGGIGLEQEAKQQAPEIILALAELQLAQTLRINVPAATGLPLACRGTRGRGGAVATSLRRSTTGTPTPAAAAKATAETPAPEPAKPAESASAAVVVPHLGAIEHLGHHQSGTAARRAGIFDTLHFVRELEGHLEIALDLVITEGSTDLAFELEALHGRKLLWTAERLPGLSKHRSSLRGIPGQHALLGLEKGERAAKEHHRQQECRFLHEFILRSEVPNVVNTRQSLC